MQTPSPEGQANAQIEVTPQMIEAGADLLMQFDWGWSNPDDFAEKIFRSMAVAAPRSL